MAHHSKEQNETLTSTSKNAKCMEKICLENILNRIDIKQVNHSTFIHDCDISADNLVNDIWPSANIKYDPNHFCKKQCNKIDSICSGNVELNDIKERIKKFYSILLHDRCQTLEEKVKKWRNSLDHFIESENWNNKENSIAIELLRQLIQKFEKTFSEIDPNYSTNSCESFNKARTLLADKGTAWRVSWRLNAYISIIRWNEIEWIQKILNAFEIFDAPLTQGQNIRKKRESTKEIRKTEESRKSRNKKRKENNNKYKLQPSDKNIHNYLKERVKKVKRAGKATRSLSKYQKIVLEAVCAHQTEDNEFVSFRKIMDHITKYSDFNELCQIKKNDS